MDVRRLYPEILRILGWDVSRIWLFGLMVGELGLEVLEANPREKETERVGGEAKPIVLTGFEGIAN